MEVEFQKKGRQKMPEQIFNEIMIFKFLFIVKMVI
jgi:hypothetical protein